MLTLTLSGQFDSVSELAGFLSQLMAAGIKPNQVQAEPTFHLTNPLIKAEQKQEPAPAQQQATTAAAGPFDDPAAGAPATTGKRRGRKAAAATQETTGTADNGGGSGGGPFDLPGQPIVTTPPISNGVDAPNEDAVRHAVAQMYARGKGGAAPGLLASFGAQNSSAVAPERRADFIAAANAIING